MKTLAGKIGIVLSSTVLAGSIATSAAAQVAQTDSGDIIVTATRQEAALSKVPISIAAYGQEQMDTQSVRNVGDIARMTPGLNFTSGGSSNGNGNRISIRGISSGIGAATTGIYIDETPIQMRLLGNTANNTYPLIFDLERVEVLRGPQGTLFGASAEGGAVRFITPKPSMESTSVYGRAEVSSTNGGGVNYEGGIALGTPIVTDKLGFRGSVWFRHDAGWVDRTLPLTRDATSYPVTAENLNTRDSVAAKATLAWKPLENLTITPSFYFQQEKLHGTPSIVSQAQTNPRGSNPPVYVQISDPTKGIYLTNKQLPEYTYDKFFLYSLLGEVDLGPVVFISSTTYFDRQNPSTSDYINTLMESWGSLQPYTLIPGEYMLAVFNNTQKTFSQEVRLQSNTDSILTWTVGAFYSRTKQFQRQDTYSDHLELLYRIRTGGAKGVRELYGSDLLPGNNYFVTDIFSTDSQISGFAQADLNVTEELKLTLGARISETKFDTSVMRDGPLAGGHSLIQANQKEHPFTPKFGISYQMTPETMFYASVAKGFRPGGAQHQLSPVACAPDFAALGITETPSTYSSDSLWSYEAGAKSRLFDNMLQFDGSVYLIKWSGIQQNVSVRSCGGTFTANLGEVTSKGFDLSTQLRPIDGLMLGVVVGYNDAKYDDTVYSVPPSVLVNKGSHINNPPLSLALSGQYDFEVGMAGAYARADYQYSNRGPEFDPGDFNYVPGQMRLVPKNNLIVRVGARFDSVDLSVFADNLTNSRETTFNRSGATRGIWTGVAPRPRVIGLTGTYRY